MDFDTRMRRLREQAEARLSRASKPVEDLSPGEIKALIHDYQVYQIELEIQNEELRDAQRQLESAKNRFARLFNDAPVGYLVIDDNGVIAQTNQTFADMVGREPHHLHGMSLTEFIVPPDRSAFYGRYRAFFKHPEGKELDFRLQSQGGELAVRCFGRLEKRISASSKGELFEGMLLMVSNISDQVRAEKTLREREQYLNAILETSQDGFWALDVQGRVTDVNAAYCRMSGYSREELLRMCIPDLEALEKPEETQDRIRRVIAKGGECFETRHRRKDGSLFDVEVCVSYIDVGGGKLICFCRDITERKRIGEQLQTMATTDELTGLWNRRHFMEHLRQEVERAKRYGQVFSLLMLDIDHFKKVNDINGHIVGDMALCHLAGLMREHLRQMDVIGRFGGEEFVVILPQTRKAGAVQLAERLRLGVERYPLRYQGKTIPLTVSIGMAEYDQRIAEADEILKLADVALYAAKNAGRNRTVCSTGSSPRPCASV